MPRSGRGCQWAARGQCPLSRYHRVVSTCGVAVTAMSPYASSSKLSNNGLLRNSSGSFHSQYSTEYPGQSWFSPQRYHCRSQHNVPSHLTRYSKFGRTPRRPTMLSMVYSLSASFLTLRLFLFSGQVGRRQVSFAVDVRRRDRRCALSGRQVSLRACR